MNICVYGAASQKIDDIYTDAVEELGYLMALRGHNLVFGAGASGIMGAAAKGVKRGNGKITGVIPKFFRDEKIEAIYQECDELIYTDSMHERKLTMEEKADAFIIAPGGIGTMEEFFEVLTLKQLGRHSKPIAIYNVNGFYDYLERFMYVTMEKKFIRASCDLLYLTFTDLDELFDYVEHQSSPHGLTVHDFKDGGISRSKR
jgi:uncharacterized protein (TIGR00730 family)